MYTFINFFIMMIVLQGQGGEGGLELTTGMLDSIACASFLTGLAYFGLSRKRFNAEWHILVYRHTVKKR